jgi:DNA-binding response OmpR family regulator
MGKARILYIEDEASLGKIVRDTLVKLGYEVRWETDGAKVIPALDEFRPDVCVLDIMLPNIDGYSLCRTIRGMYRTLPVIFLTAKAETTDLVAGFEAGGTDYVKKPFSIEELIARIENQIYLMTGHRKALPDSEPVGIGKFTLEPGTYELRSPEGSISLSNRDMQVLRLLHANRNRVILRKDLLMSVWGDDSYFNSRNLDVYIRKIRGYLRDDQSVKIITLKGNGYLFIVP